MAEKDYDEPNLNAEDPELTPQNRWRWAVPVILLILLPIAGMYGLRETTGDAPWPSFAAYIQGRVSSTQGAVGTSGSTNDSVSLPGDPRSMVGRQIEVQVPVAERANDGAFWIGEKNNRILVVPRRDHRDGSQRQEGLVAAPGITSIEAGQTASISGSIQKLPRAEEMYSWGLTRRDSQELAAMGVYLRVDRASVQ